MYLLLVDMLVVTTDAYYSISCNAKFIASIPRKCLYNVFQDCHLFGSYLCIFLDYFLNISARFCQHSHPKFGTNILAVL